MDRPAATPFEYASLALAVGALGVVLQFNLLVAVFSACATYALADWLPSTKLFQKTGLRARVLSTTLVAAIPVIAVVLAGMGLGYLNSHASGTYTEVFTELSRIVSEWRDRLPAAAAAMLPVGPEAIRPWLLGLMKTQSGKLTQAGQSGAHGLLMALVGVVIGLLLANVKTVRSTAPLSIALLRRADRFQTSFTAIVAAQFWIASINTCLTAIFFFIIVPLMGVKMPYAGPLLALTFMAGMLPVAGNLLCNTVTTVVALSVGPMVAVAALVFLIVIHKLEYVISARVVGTRTNMAAWELLTAMFVFEACFGVAGLVAAPLFYAYLKSELRGLGWV